MILFDIAFTSVKKNKIRTLSTILGIMLSVSLLTSVILLVFSSSDYLTEVISSKSGTWHLAASHQSVNDYNKYENDGYAKEIGTLQSIGFSDSTPDRNYLYIEGTDTAYLDMLPVEVIKGRLPVSSSEIILPQEYIEKSSLSIGDSIMIGVGIRYSTDLEKNIGTNVANYTDDEILVDVQNRQYTIVGICEKLPSEAGPAPIWYSAYTGLDTNLSDRSTYTYYFRFDDTASIIPYYENVLREQQIPNARNSEYLLTLGINGESGYRILIYAIGLLLTLLVLFGAVSLIHNSFAISIQQRIRELGILTSVGATYGQIKRMLFIEAASMCVLGIPLGIFAGFIAVKIIIRIWGQSIISLFNTSAEFVVKFPLSALLFIIAISFMTVWISTVIPARKLNKISPIEAIRQRTEPIRAKSLAVSKWVQRIYGIKGVLAEREYKANRKKYRSIVITLAMSLVFYTGTLSIAHYVDCVVTEYFPSTSSDIYLYSYPDKITVDDPTIISEVESLDNIQIDAEAYCYGIPILLSQNIVADGVFDYSRKEQTLVNEQYVAMTSVQFLEDNYFNEYLSELGIEHDTFMINNELCAIAYDKINLLDSASGQNVNSSIFKSHDRQNISLQYIDEIGYENTKCFENSPLKISIVDFAQELPKGLDTGNSGYGDSLHLILPESARADVSALFKDYFNVEKIIACTASNHSEAFDSIKQIIDDANIPVDVVDYAAKYQGSTGIVSLIRFIATVLVIVFVAIGMANLFNIMYASIRLRKKEFAVLQSVGMSERELHQMLNLECMKYWSKSFLYGTLISFLINLSLYFVVSKSFDIGYSFPYIALLAATFVIGLCIFTIKNMVMRKENSGSIITAIRSESN